MAVNSIGTDVPTAALSDKAGVPSAVNMCITIGARYDGCDLLLTDVPSMMHPL